MSQKGSLELKIMKYIVKKLNWIAEKLKKNIS